MKILFLQDTDWIQRNPHQQVHLAERMVQKGHEVHVIDYEILWRNEKKQALLTKRKVHSVSKVFPEVKIKVFRPPILKIPILDYISMVFTYSREINYQVKEFKPDIILAMDILIAFLAYPFAKRYGIPVVYYTIDIDYRLIPYRFLQTFGKWIESWNIRHADMALSINEGLREYTIRMGADPKNTRVIRAGVDFQRLHFGVNGDEIRKNYSIETEDILLFFVGWLYHFSGLKEVAVELSKINDDRIKLLIVGDGDAYEDLQNIQQEYGLENRMILAGRQPYQRLPEFLAAADICLLPAYNNEIMRDIVPIKMYEYMAMNNPVISTKLPGVMKEFGENNGVIYIDRSEDTINKTLELISNDAVQREGKKARKFVERMSWDIITDEFETFLEEFT